MNRRSFLAGLTAIVAGSVVKAGPLRRWVPQLDTRAFHGVDFGREQATTIVVMRTCDDVVVIDDIIEFTPSREALRAQILERLRSEPPGYGFDWKALLKTKKPT